jgi:hypothetical protein
MKKLTILMTIVGVSCAQNQVRPPTVTGILKKECPIQGSNFPTSDVLTAMVTARSQMRNAVGHDLKPIPKETPDEEKILLLDMPTSKCVLEVSYASAKADLCNLDYKQSNFLPFMQMLRSEIGRIDKPIAYAGLLHGVGLERSRQQLNGNDFKCSKKDKENLEAQLAVWK